MDDDRLRIIWNEDPTTIARALGFAIALPPARGNRNSESWTIHVTDEDWRERLRGHVAMTDAEFDDVRDMSVCLLRHDNGVEVWFDLEEGIQWRCDANQVAQVLDSISRLSSEHSIEMSSIRAEGGDEAVLASAGFEMDDDGDWILSADQTLRQAIGVGIADMAAGRLSKRTVTEIADDIDREDVRTQAVAAARALGLPDGWADKLPTTELPCEYSPAVYDKLEAAPDGWLAWKAQEWLARSGRAAECDADLVADALMMAADDDGPGKLIERLERILFVLAWPKHSYHLRVRLGQEADLLRQAIEGAPSLTLFIDARTIRSAWWQACFEVEALDPEQKLLTMGCKPAEHPCPWETLAEVLAAVEVRLSCEQPGDDGGQNHAGGETP